MLRNLVTSLLEHEQIQTTLPKAKEAARLAEKLITLGKRRNERAYRLAQGFVLKPNVLPKLFITLRRRYANRPGGYTRIIKYGNRPGDNAPKAILELVDNPRDLKLEMTAKAVGWDLLTRNIGEENDMKQVEVGSIAKMVQSVADNETKGIHLREFTQRNLKKVFKCKSKESVVAGITSRAGLHMARLLAQPKVFGGLRHQEEVEKSGKNITTYRGYTVHAGQRLTGMYATGLQLAKGALGKKPMAAGSRFWEQRTKLGIRPDSATARL